MYLQSFKTEEYPKLKLHVREGLEIVFTPRQSKEFKIKLHNALVTVSVIGNYFSIDTTPSIRIISDSSSDWIDIYIDADERLKIISVKFVSVFIDDGEVYNSYWEYQKDEKAIFVSPEQKVELESDAKRTI
jgi:hypothetical protein